MPGFNLVDQKWIPCLMHGAEEKNIKETLLEAGTIKEIVDSSPLVTVALHRCALNRVSIFGQPD